VLRQQRHSVDLELLDQIQINVRFERQTVGLDLEDFHGLGGQLVVIALDAWADHFSTHRDHFYFASEPTLDLGLERRQFVQQTRNPGSLVPIVFRAFDWLDTETPLANRDLAAAVYRYGEVAALQLFGNHDRHIQQVLRDLLAEAFRAFDVVY